ncbi:MAG TPA: hemolysin family protein [Candidatus Hydrogenedentes bacterium]|nr:hemolysin family protein [Candidatus Hydrogenedentota bacterium]
MAGCGMAFAGTESLPSASGWAKILTPEIWAATLVFLMCSAFFSATELAFFSLHQLRLRSMRESTHVLDRLVARLMEHPSNLLITILMGNCVVNVGLGVVFGGRVEQAFQANLPVPDAVSYALAVFCCTAVVLFFGEITPKIAVVYFSEPYARTAAVPIFIIDRVLSPLRAAIIQFVAFLFRITLFSQVRPAPFMTDEEFLSLLSEVEATGVIEEDERFMIQGIMKFSDVTVADVLTPRPDMVALPAEASVREALEQLRTHEYARVPVYEGDLDHIAGILFAKELLPKVICEHFDDPIRPLLRKAHFVPHTMSCADFLKTAQRLRAHIAIVVDEFGGTEGLVTLQDAVREVVGDVGEDAEEAEHLYSEIQPGVYRLDGRLPLDELEQLTGKSVEDDEHATVAGFLMKQADKVPAPGDKIKHDGVLYVIEEVRGKRIAQVRMQAPMNAKKGVGA